MRPTHTYIFTLLCLSGALPAVAQESSPWGLERVVQAALKASPAVRASRERLGIAEANAVRARQLLPENPTLEIEFGTDAFLTQHGERRQGFGISQAVEIAGQRGLRKKVAGKRRAETQAQVAHLETTIARDAATGYLSLWRAEQIRGLAQETLALNLALLNAAEARLRAGDISELDRNTAALEYARARESAQTTETVLVRARGALNLLLALPPAQVLNLAEPSFGSVPALEERVLIADAKRRRLDLSAAQIAQEAAAAETALRKRERIPSPILALKYEEERGRIDYQGTAIAEVDRLAIVQISLPLPVWDRQRGEITAARAQQKRSEIEREALERQIEQEILSAVDAVQRTQSTLKGFEEVLPMANRNLELLQRAYQAGQTNLLELLNVRDRTLTLKREYIEAKKNYAQALFELVHAQGQISANGVQF